MDGEFLSQIAAAEVLDLCEPAARRLPLVLASPHSGSEYPADFLTASRLDPLALRQSEDSFVDELFAAAPLLGAPLLSARFPRAYLDVNREAYELDPTSSPTHCRAMSMPARRGFASVSARSPASLPAARISTRGNCASRTPNSASSASTTLTTKCCAGWSKRRPACSAAISSSIAIRCRRVQAAARTAPISSSGIVTGRLAPPGFLRQPLGFSPSVVSGSQSMRPMPGASRRDFTDGPAHIDTRCRSRSTGRSIWTNGAIAERR